MVFDPVRVDHTLEMTLLGASGDVFLNKNTKKIKGKKGTQGQSAGVISGHLSNVSGGHDPIIRR